MGYLSILYFPLKLWIIWSEIDKCIRILPLDDVDTMLKSAVEGLVSVVSWFVKGLSSMVSYNFTIW